MLTVIIASVGVFLVNQITPDVSFDITGITQVVITTDASTQCLSLINEREDANIDAAELPIMSSNSTKRQQKHSKLNLK